VTAGPAQLAGRGPRGRTRLRWVEFLMGYYAILDRAPKGRDEGDGFQLWIRRHDEYDSQ